MKDERLETLIKNKDVKGLQQYKDRQKFKLDSLNPVSYTHLDVYKRQDEDLVDIPSENLDEEDSLIEEPTKKAEPKGTFNFLNLDEVDAFKDTVFGNQPDLFNNDKLSWKEKQAIKNNAPEYMVCLLYTSRCV